MISVTKLLFARDYFGDRLRYTKNAHTMRNGAAEGVGPQVDQRGDVGGDGVTDQDSSAAHGDCLPASATSSQGPPALPRRAPASTRDYAAGHLLSDRGETT